MRKLRDLTLNTPNVTGRGVSRLSACSSLDHLSLYGQWAGDSHAEGIQKVTTLRDLQFCRSSLTDDGMRHIGKLTGLRRLDLMGNAPLTAAGFEHLRHLTNLEELRLELMLLPEGTLRPVRELENLKVLELGYDGITDRDLENLKDLHHLTALKICSKAVTHEGLRHLASLTDLQRLE